MDVTATTSACTRGGACCNSFNNAVTAANAVPGTEVRVLPGIVPFTTTSSGVSLNIVGDGRDASILTCSITSATNCITVAQGTNFTNIGIVLYASKFSTGTFCAMSYSGSSTSSYGPSTLDNVSIRINGTGLSGTAAPIGVLFSLGSGFTTPYVATEFIMNEVMIDINSPNSLNTLGVSFNPGSLSKLRINDVQITSSNPGGTNARGVSSGSANAIVEIEGGSVIYATGASSNRDLDASSASTIFLGPGVVLGGPTWNPSYPPVISYGQWQKTRTVRVAQGRGDPNKCTAEYGTCQSLTQAAALLATANGITIELEPALATNGCYGIGITETWPISLCPCCAIVCTVPGKCCLKNSAAFSTSTQLIKVQTCSTTNSYNLLQDLLLVPTTGATASITTSGIAFTDASAASSTKMKRVEMTVTTTGTPSGASVAVGVQYTGPGTGTTPADNWWTAAELSITLVQSSSLFTMACIYSASQAFGLRVSDYNCYSSSNSGGNTVYSVYLGSTTANSVYLQGGKSNVAVASSTGYELFSGYTSGGDITLDNHQLTAWRAKTAWKPANTLLSLSWGATAAITSNTVATYLPPFAFGSSSTSIVGMRLAATLNRPQSSTVPGYISCASLTFHAPSAGSGGTQMTCTLNANGANTALAVSVANTATFGTITTPVLVPIGATGNMFAVSCIQGTSGGTSPTEFYVSLQCG